MTKTAFAGLETRLDEHGRELAWKVVISEKPPAIDAQTVFRLPDGVRYVSPPQDANHGDLRALPLDAEAAVTWLAKNLHGQGIGHIKMSRQHVSNAVPKILEWNDVRVDFHEINYNESIPSYNGPQGQAGDEIVLLSAQTGDKT